MSGLKSIRMRVDKGRLRAAFVCVCAVVGAMFVAGCASDRSNPWVSTFTSFVPGTSEKVGKQAAAIPYASVKLSVGRAGGLLILAEQTEQLTFWQSSKRETIVFRNGYLNATRGLASNLLSSRMVSADGAPISPWNNVDNAPVHYRVERSWEDADGKRHAVRARASFVCADKKESVKLPLTTLDLTRCVESLDWDGGKQTRSVVWQDLETHRIWAADAVAWPGGLRVTWKVARPWW